MESFRQEVIRKRRYARLFWVIVFAFATLLYFFFQGYYPNFRGSLDHFLSQTGSFTLPKEPDLIRSFGIINVKTNPKDATMMLDSENYGQNDKKMVDYGEYALTINRPQHLPESLRFIIDEEKPFFIENITLLPIPQYRVLTGVLDAYQVSTDKYLLRTKSGVLSSSGLTDTGAMIAYGAMKHLGNGYFQSGSGLVFWNGQSLKETSREMENFVKTCKDIRFEFGVFLCDSTNSLYTPDGIYSTGILDIHDGMVAKSGTLISLQDGKITRYPNHSGALDLKKVTILNNNLYTLSSGSLISDSSSTDPIPMDLDTIDYSILSLDEMIMIGKSGTGEYLIIRNIRDPLNRTRKLLLPDNIDYTTIQAHIIDGNTFIQAKDAILFVYRGSSEVRWIVEGDIIGMSSTGALYQKNGAIWIADWYSRQ